MIKLIFLLSCTVFLNCCSQIYTHPCSVYQNYPPHEAFNLLKEQAELGDADAQFLVGRMLSLGEGIDQNHWESISWYHKAASLNHACALNNLAFEYKMGNYILKNESLAFQLTESATRSGHPAALASLGEAYYYGHGTAVDKNKAFFYYQKALKKGGASALFCIGKFYWERSDMNQDKLQGLTLLLAYDLWQKDNSIKLRHKSGGSFLSMHTYIEDVVANSSAAMIKQASSQAQIWYVSNRHRLFTREELIQQCCRNGR